MRSYRQYCAIAKALDVIGDRWNMLIVRELLLQGACRYTDLHDGLPGIATNLLAERLRDLEREGIVTREEAPPPIASTLFRLTPRGQELKTILFELGRWGAPLMTEPDEQDAYRGRWLASPYPWAAALVAMVVFSPVLIWNYQHDWASFRFQLVRATATHELSLRTVGDYIGLQFGLVGFILLPVVLSGVVLTAWRGYRRGDAVAILLSTAVIVPFGYFFWKSLSLRIGDTWPMFIWPVGFAAAAINVTMLAQEGQPAWMIQSTIRWARVAIASGIVFVVAVFLYYTVAPWNLIGRADPIGGEAGYRQVVERAQAQLQDTGASWIATTDYRTYAMLRWFFNGRVPVIQINERNRFEGFRDPGMNAVSGRTGLYVGRDPDSRNHLWQSTTAIRQPLERVERSWRGIVMDTYALEKLTGWTPELSPQQDSPLYRARTLAGEPERLRGNRGFVIAASVR